MGAWRSGDQLDALWVLETEAPFSTGSSQQPFIDPKTCEFVGVLLISLQRYSIKVPFFLRGSFRIHFYILVAQSEANNENMQCVAGSISIMPKLPKTRSLPRIH